MNITDEAKKHEVHEKPEHPTDLTHEKHGTQVTHSEKHVEAETGEAVPPQDAPKYKFVKVKAEMGNLHVLYQLVGAEHDTSENIAHTAAEDMPEEDVKKLVAEQLGIHDLDIIEVEK